MVEGEGWGVGVGWGWGGRGRGGRRLSVPWPRLRLPDLYNQHPFVKAHVPHLAEEQPTAATLPHVRTT